MIASVSGRVLGIAPDSVVISVGGIGVVVLAAPHVVADLREGGPCTLHTSLVVREDSLTLFGFANLDERAMFELLQTASGVGPKLAQAMLAVLRPDDVRRAITSGDLVTLTKVPGVGRKGAERMVVELRDRVGPPLDGARGAREPEDARGSHAWSAPVIEALTGLGWSQRDAEAAVAEIEPPGAGEVPLPELLKAALRVLRRV